jgi:hypothetical protein
MLLKRLMILPLLSLFTVNIHAQDTLVLRTGKIIQAKITDIRPAEIVYKKYRYQDGPTVTVKKNEVFYIKYPDGSIDTMDIVQEEISQALTNNIPANTAILFFYRPGKMLSSARPSDIYLNDSFLFKVYNGKIMKLELPAGRYTFVARVGEKHDSEEVRVENGQQHYIKCLVKSGLFKDEPDLMTMGRKEGTEETAKMEAIYNLYNQGKKEKQQPVSQPGKQKNTR